MMRIIHRVIRYWQKSLSLRIAGTIFLVAGLGVMAVSFLAYEQASGSLSASVYERLNAVSTLKEDDLNRWVDQQRLDLVFLAWQPDVRAQAGILLGGSAPEAERKAAHEVLLSYLQFVITSVSDSSELFILDLDGRVALSTLAGRQGQLHTSDLFFSQGLSATYVQPVYTGRASGRPTITASTPLFDQSRRRVGVLAGHLNLARLDRIILERTGLGMSGETYLVNSAGEFVSAAQAAPGPARSSGIASALTGKDGQGLYTNYQGVPVVGVYNWLDERGAALMVEISQAEALAPARQLAFTIIQAGLLAALLLAGVASLLARQITRPIRAITTTARLVAAGDLTQAAPVVTGDEVGLLARTFNQMTGQLRLLYRDLEKKVQERTAELVQVNTRLKDEITVREQVQESLRSQKKYLEALHETSLGLISRLDLVELFEDLVRRAGQLMGTDHGYIYIAGTGGDNLECKVGVGFFSNLVGYRLTPGEGLAGTIWQSGQPLIINDYDNWAGRVKTVEKGQIHSIMGVPLTSGSQVVGVLGLAYDCVECGDRIFEENQIELLNRFAHLASIALDNARLYTAAREARSAAEAANQAKSEFLANVSHELRTPLTSIVGFARILQKRLREHIFPLVPSGEARAQRAAGQVDDNLGIILSEGQRLTEMINNLLDLEKIQAGKMTWKMAPLQVAEVIRLAAAATASLFEAKGLEWVEQIDPALPAVTGDRDRLEQVMINLISNAVKFSNAGRITCRVLREGGEIVVSVQDQGIGIAPADHAAVFEKFKQVGDSLTGKPKGTGLGLPICKEIVAHHGGRMWLESGLGQGSTFYFALPLDGRPPQEPANWTI